MPTACLFVKTGVFGRQFSAEACRRKRRVIQNTNAPSIGTRALH
ncbi:hypothetical protein HMPREF1861_02353 [Corynebacterium kroppenstedtii]|nr:hypothetical protein HMPREF1861_02353 [Corynebacterium kroppenstedtii]